MKSKKYIITLASVALVAFGAGILMSASPNDLGMGRNIEKLVNMYRDLSIFYVDEVDSDKLMKDAAEGMVRNLDPYTEFLAEEDMPDFELMTTGKYGGVGSQIRKKGDWVIFSRPYEDSPAMRAGIKAGDKLISINGKDAKGMAVNEASKNLRGEAGTTLNLTIETLLEGERKDLTIKRERISVSSVPYHGFVADGIGYIEHTDFTENSSEDLRNALMSMKNTGELKGLILDYRSNGGGIVQEAVKIMSMFTPKGTEIVSMRGRQKRIDGSYKTDNAPVSLELPIVVLTNNGSASAAEILAGAMQDLDRGVVVGRRTYGKGLVQSTRPMGYNTWLKVTTQKYYMPSGRCVQAIDYAHRNEDGSVSSVPDSLITEFTTRGGRKVYDGGGVMPDVVTPLDDVSRFVVVVFSMGHLDDFVDEFVKRHNSRLEGMDEMEYEFTDADYAEFVEFMTERSVEYESLTRSTLKLLKRNAELERYGDDVAEQIRVLEQKISDDKNTNLELYKGDLKGLITSEVIIRYRNSKGVTRHNLQTDKDVLKAVEILRDGERYKEILTSQDTQRK